MQGDTIRLSVWRWQICNTDSTDNVSKCFPKSDSVYWNIYMNYRNARIVPYHLQFSDCKNDLLIIFVYSMILRHFNLYVSLN